MLPRKCVSAKEYCFYLEINKKENDNSIDSKVVIVVITKSAARENQNGSVIVIEDRSGEDSPTVELAQILTYMIAWQQRF